MAPVPSRLTVTYSIKQLPCLGACIQCSVNLALKISVCQSPGLGSPIIVPKKALHLEHTSWKFHLLRRVVHSSISKTSDCRRLWTRGHQGKQCYYHSVHFPVMSNRKSHVVAELIRQKNIPNQYLMPLILVSRECSGMFDALCVRDKARHVQSRSNVNLRMT